MMHRSAYKVAEYTTVINKFELPQRDDAKCAAVTEAVRPGSLQQPNLAERVSKRPKNQQS